MSFLSKSDLLQILPTCISPFNPDRVDEVAYGLALGNEAYLTDSATGKKEILDGKNPQVVIKPGQFALLLTEEVIEIPEYILAFISIKFSQKIKGLINVSGFHVDPGFKGKIIFSVYNAGPATIVLDKGQPYFMIWFSELKSAAPKYKGSFNSQNTISAEIISKIKGDLASPNILLERIKEKETQLRNLLWLGGVLVSLFVAIALKVFFDSNRFNEGYLLGKKDNEANQLLLTSLEKINLDSLIRARVDSILNHPRNDASNKK